MPRVRYDGGAKCDVLCGGPSVREWLPTDRRTS